MSSFTVIATDSVGRVIGSVAISESHERLVGRASSCALVLDGASVSRVHAVFSIDGGELVVRDAGSANGVRVDGKLIRRATRLRSESVVNVGEYVLRMAQDAKGADPVGALDEESPSEPSLGGISESAQGAEFETRFEARPVSRARRVLVGRGGAYDGVRFVLDKTVTTLGRDASCDVVLDHVSVSRRHAQLRVNPTGDGMTVLDLRSANGTYLRGEPVKRAEVADGAVLRFGDLSFKLEAGAGPGKLGGSDQRRRSRLVLVVAAVLVLLVVVGGLGVVVWPRLVGRRALTLEDRLREQIGEAQVAIDDARRELAARSWSKAIERLNRALELDPANTQARQWLARAQREQSYAVAYQQAMRRSVLGTREDLWRARKLLRGVPGSSVYAPDARQKLNDVEMRLAQGYRNEGIERCRHGDRRACYRALCRYFELLPISAGTAGQRRLRKRMRAIEAKEESDRSFEPCKARRYRGRSAAALSVDVGETLIAHYHDADLAQVARLYHDGHVDQAIARLKKLERDRRRQSVRPQIDRLAEQLAVIRGQYSEGYSLLRQRRVREADHHWSILLAADRAILPQPLESVYRREVTRALGELYYELGQDELELGRYAAAFPWWYRGKQIDQHNAKLGNGLLQLEGVAQRLISEARQLMDAGDAAEARAKLALARDICQPGRPIRKEAEEALRAVGEQP